MSAEQIFRPNEPLGAPDSLQMKVIEVACLGPLTCTEKSGVQGPLGLP